MALIAAAVCAAGESFPVVHNEPIVVRVVGGKDGRPLGRMHLTLVAGYDRNDMREQLYREDVLTDAHGEARLSNQLANLPWLQVWVGKKSLCQKNPRSAGFSVELVRGEGLSTPNRCGLATVEDKPSVLTVFVKGTGAARPAAVHEATAQACITTMAEAAVASGAGRCSSICSTGARHRCGYSRLIVLLPGLAVATR